MAKYLRLIVGQAFIENLFLVVTRPGLVVKILLRLTASSAQPSSKKELSAPGLFDEGSEETSIASTLIKRSELWWGRRLECGRFELE